MNKRNTFNFIDLFAGCGGLSEGFYMENFYSLAHVEIDKDACETLKKRMNYYNYTENEITKSVLNVDITSDNILELLDESVGNKEVDVIIGGPPCQSFSSLGRAKDQNAMQDDPRNYLFESYVKILNHFKPKFFVFENVTGILTAKLNGKLIIEEIISKLSENYKVNFTPKMIVLNSVNYGVPQLRKRVIIIGVRNDINITPDEIYASIEPTHYDTDYLPSKDLKKYVTVAEAISDLPTLLPGQGKELVEFKIKETNDYIKRIRRSDFKLIYNHVARTHNDKDIQRYTEMSKNKWTLTELYENRPDLIHEKKRLFKNSYVVQVFDLPAKTIIAHLYKDGNQFIHPDYRQGRTFTAREAARIQSFPDDFIFMGSRTQQYKQIGNAVPPLFANSIAKSIKKYLLKVVCTKEEI
ncbi:DNA cytosine methyltransferase [Clostridium estertheticum]|uniref:DNA cytosine methyltransferase n=1 Tax=Clostridium estertheticum TaxID=238834 RepID=UPI001C0B467D|nr:DNA cytosine methyltransferase [Clostridium estertheticum]MBU3217448.1 DNA cytosine methyltransferase [Clostridium estertheticum]WAG56626.1 DNA cytosine methyltransferase [Clostridium estertheticum]